MTVIELSGRINDAGKLEVDLPWEQRPWTDEELRDLLTFEPAASGAEIVTMLAETDGWWKDGSLNNTSNDG